MERKQYKDEIRAIFIICNEMAYLEMVKTAAQYLKNLSIPVTVLYDIKTPKEELLLISGFNFDQYIQAPESLSNNIPLKHKWIYDQTDAHYILFNQSDDYATIYRAIIPIEILKENPEVGVCLCGFYIFQDEKFTDTKDYFKQVRCGFNVGYPSCWTFNKDVIPELPLLVGFEWPYAYEWDVYMLLLLQQRYTIWSLPDPLVLYNKHINSGTSHSEHEIVHIRFQELCNYYSFIQGKLIPLLENQKCKSNFEIIEETISNYCQYLRVDETYKPPNDFRKAIVVVGWMHPGRMAGGLVLAFRKYFAEQYQVIAISTDLCPKEQIIECSWYLVDQPKKKQRSLELQKERLVLAPILNQFSVSYAIIIQNTVLEYDTSNLTIPWYYIHHEMCYPQWPYTTNTKAQGLFWSFIGAFEQLWWLYRPEIEKTQFNTFLTYAAELDVFPNRQTIKQYFIGFKGTLKYNCGQQPIWQNVYDNRNRILTYLIKYNKTWNAKWQLWKLNRKRGQLRLKDLIRIEPREFHNKNESESFVDFCNQCSVAINISGNWGMVNERQFQVIAMGCVLLQWEYPELKVLGFYDHWNCVTFKNEKTLLQQVKWMVTHPLELEAIRGRGMELVKTYHTYKQRVERILAYIDHNKDYQEYIPKLPRQLKTKKLQFFYQKKELPIYRNGLPDLLNDLLFKQFKCFLSSKNCFLVFTKEYNYCGSLCPIYYCPEEEMREPTFIPETILLFDQKQVNKIPQIWLENYSIECFNIVEPYEQQRFLKYLEMILKDVMP